MEDVRRELRKKKALLQFEIRTFMELRDPEESRKSAAKIKELATDIVNLRKELKGAKELRREFRRKRR